MTRRSETAPSRRNRVKLEDLFPALELLSPEAGDSHRSFEIHRIASVEKAREGDLIFIATESALGALGASKASLAVVSEVLHARAMALGLAMPMLPVKDAMLAFAKASWYFRTESEPDGGVHPTAFVHPSARLGANVSVGAHAVIGAEAELENNVVIHAAAHIGARVRLGAEAVIFPGVVIYQDCTIGARVRIHANSVIGADGFGYVQERHETGVRHVKIHHLGGVSIGADCEIGASTTIDRGTIEDTILEQGCIIDNQVQIGHNCHLEEGVIICGHTGLAGSVRVGKYAVLAGFVGVNNKVIIGAGARVAGFTAVQGHVPPGVTWGGIPGMPHRKWLRTQLLFENLPELLDQRKKRGSQG